MNFLKHVIELFTNDWWLKLIALLLAIVIYHSIKTDKTRNQDNTRNDRPIFQQFR